jgi:serine/threonine protein kinase
MADMIADHPHLDELQAYGQGRLTSEACLSLEEHLAGCARCCELLEKAPGDSFLHRLRGAGSSAPPDPGRTTDTDILEAPGTGNALAVPAELINHPRYRVLGLVGQGGMGAVYRAEHRRMQRLVALKVIRPGLMRNPAAVQRFHQEARAAAQLQHPNIVTAFDADQAGGLHFLVMEYVEGISLAQLVSQCGPLPVAEACNCVRQAALGLQHAHEQGMVHRDVKPQNLMLQARRTGGSPVPGTPGGQANCQSYGSVVKILDFGLARLPRTADAPPVGDAPTGALTGAGAVMGTADYIAPEQASDSRTADIRADIYSLGCTLFYLLTGRPPFPDGSVAEKLNQHADTPLPPLGELRPEVPPALAAVVRRMTAKLPADRYTTPAAVAQALTPFCLPGKVQPRRRPKRLRLVAAVVLFVGALLAVALGFGLHRQGEEARRQKEPPNAKRPEPAGNEKKAELTEEQAVAALKKLGSQISRDEQAPGKPVVFVRLGDPSVTDAELKYVSALPNLTTLALPGTKITDKGMKQIGELKHLVTLDL